MTNLGWRTLTPEAARGIRRRLDFPRLRAGLLACMAVLGTAGVLVADSDADASLSRDLAGYRAAMAAHDHSRMAGYLPERVLKSLGGQAAVTAAMAELFSGKNDELTALANATVALTGPEVRVVWPGSQPRGPKAVMLVRRLPITIEEVSGPQVRRMHGALVAISEDEGRTWRFNDFSAASARRRFFDLYPELAAIITPPTVFLEIEEAGTKRYKISTPSGGWVESAEHPLRWPQVRLRQAGLWETRDPKFVDKPGASGAVSVSGAVHQFLETTRRFKARVGLSFGYVVQFEEGLPGREYQIRHVIRHPPLVQPDGSVVRQSGGPRSTTLPDQPGVVLSSTNRFSFLAGYEYELVPGTWIFETWVDDRKVVEESFEVLPAEE